MNLAWEDLTHIEISKTKFTSPLAAFERMLELNRDKKLYLTLALSYEFGGLFENIKTPLRSNYEIPLYIIYAFNSTVCI